MTRENRDSSILFRGRCTATTCTRSTPEVNCRTARTPSTGQRSRQRLANVGVLVLASVLVASAGAVTLAPPAYSVALPLVDNREMVEVGKEDKRLATELLSSDQGRTGVLAVMSEEECPAGCLCKWSSGKQTAECGAAQLTEVPEGLNRDTQVLNLSGNAIPSLGPREFHSKGYSSLQRIYVSRCGLSVVAPSAFHLLTNLVELDLSANRLQRVPSSALSDCGALRRLSLSHNPIETLHDDAFRGLSRLGTLELNHCRLMVVESLAFRGLRSLEFLRMAHNLLKRIPPNALIEHLPPQLYGVNLEENPWTCDCEMRQVRQWMEENNIPLSAPPKCAHPHRLQGISWQALELADFACAPELAAIDSVAAAVEAENASLRCEVEAQPPSGTSISWSFNGRSIRNMSLISFGRQLYVIREEESLGRVKTSVLTIVNAFVKDSGSYTCVAANRAGNVSGLATLHVYPREEFGPLTSAEIGGVVLGFLLTLVVLVGAVYMVMQQYQSYCQQRAASSGSVLDEHADRGLKGAQDKGQTLKEKGGGKGSGGVKIPSCAKPSYETIVTLTKGNGHVGVDLVNSTNTGAAPFTELRTPDRPQKPDASNEGGSSSNHSVLHSSPGAISPTGGVGELSYSQQALRRSTPSPTRGHDDPTGYRGSAGSPRMGVAAGANSATATASDTVGTGDLANGVSASGGAPATKQQLSAFEKNNASLVNAIASELEEKIANRVIENLNLRNRQSQLVTGPSRVAGTGTGHAPLRQTRPLSDDLDDHVPPPPAPKETPSAKSKDFLNTATVAAVVAPSASLKARPNGSVSARIVHGAASGAGSSPVVGEAGGACAMAAGVQLAHVQANPGYHLDLRGESRDSPDEGLGDERDYETDEGPHT